MLRVDNPPVEISPLLQRLAQRRWDIANPYPEARIQGIFTRFRDAIAHFFLYRLYQDYREFYRSLGPRIAPAGGAQAALWAHSSQEDDIPIEEVPPITRTIEEEKEWLHEQRLDNPKQFPLYLDELLDGGHLYLYQHLLQTGITLNHNRCWIDPNQISFSSASHIILETKEAFIRKIESAIPEDHGPILFLIGAPGSGKSTTFCFLRGDPMIERGIGFESSCDAQQLIEHSNPTPGPLLPAVAVNRGWTIIDFPSLDNFQGPLVSLGAEFALKALLSKYAAQILVIEPIIDYRPERRLAELRVQLERLIENKSCCLLGLTKYSATSDYGALKAIEKSQRSRLQAPSEEEYLLQGEINALDMTIPTLEESPFKTDFIERRTALQEQLNTLQQTRQEQQLSPLPNLAPLPDTEAKQQCRARLRAAEQPFLTRMELQGPLRFDKLDDPGLIDECFAVLSQERETARVRPQLASDPERLDINHKLLLRALFESQLKLELESQRDYIQPNDMEHLRQLIASSSLIAVICSQSHPEIGKFLHAPENDPRIVREYDQTLIQNSIDACLELAYRGLLMNIIYEILDRPPSNVSLESLEELRRASEALRDYVLRLSGVYPEGFPGQAAGAWRNQQQERHFHGPGEPTFPRWAPALLGLPSDIRYGIPTLAQWYHRNRRVANVDNACVENLIREIRFVHEALLKLKQLSEMICPQNLDHEESAPS